MIIVIIVFLVLLLLLGGLFIFLNRRNAGNQTKFQKKNTAPHEVADRAAAKKSSSRTTDPAIAEESVISDANTSEVGLAVENEPAPVNPVTVVDQQRNKRGGYSKQQFDDLE